MLSGASGVQMWNVLCLHSWRRGTNPAVQEVPVTVTTWPTPRRPGRKRINVAARGPGPGDLERVRSVFGLLDNPWPALQIWEYLGLSWGKGNVSEFRRARGAAGPLSPSRPGNQMKPQVKSYFIFFPSGTAAEKPGQHRVPAAQD